MKNTFRLTLIVFTMLSIIFSVVNGIDAQFFPPLEAEKLSGKKAPEFTAKDLSGKSVSLSSFKGKPVLLNFWATWCPYCREERQYLSSLYKEYKGSGLVIIAVSTDKSVEIVRSYLKKMPADFVVLHDDSNDAASSYSVYSLPTNFLIDREGTIRHKFIGLRNWTNKESKKLIEELIK